ncbi:MAG: acyl-homoserine-lactone synthase [Pseudomonadota bacterium]
MIFVIKGKRGPNYASLLDSMFADRKALFVDLLGWAVSAHDGRHEMDEFDSDEAVYIIAGNQDGQHCGSLRLLPTSRPYLLQQHFASLCADELPSDTVTYEITRLCLPSRLGAKRRLIVRNQLIAAMVDYALANGIIRLVGVTEAAFRNEVLSMGWLAEPLGPICESSGRKIGAFALHIGADTPKRLSWADIYPVDALSTSKPNRAAGGVR